MLHPSSAAGIGAIGDRDACTYADEKNFFCYRRMTHRGEADYGRHVNAIVLERGAGRDVDSQTQLTMTIEEHGGAHHGTVRPR